MTAIPQAGTDLPVIPMPRDARCPLAPPAEFTQWREMPGMVLARWRDRPTWVCSRYEDIRAALVDPRLSADTVPDSLKVAAGDNLAVIFPRIDDPEHNRLRRMMTRDFTFRRAEAMRPQIQEICDGLIDDILATGPPCDIVRDFALPVPSLVISLLLGVPYADHRFFQENSATGLDSRSTDEQKSAAIGALFGYMFDLVALKERDPGDDLMSRLITEHVATGELSRETAAMNGLILLQAGHETSASMIALGTLALLEHPEALAQLRESDDPALVGSTVEELMRYLTIVHSLVERVALQDCVIGGESIRAGDIVLMNLPAGNWDPDFVDNPDLLDPERNARGHLGFGYGAHQCIGANLARVEMQITLTSLVRRLPGLRLATPVDDLQFQNEQEIFGIKELLVTW
jgi:cytochrome P450